MTRLAPLPERDAAFSPVMTWDVDHGDFAVAPLTDPVNPGGLISDGALIGAIATLLFSDCAGMPDPLDPADIDLRGWPGDYFDVDRAAGEAPLGNLTWMLARHPTNAATARLSEIYAEQALQPLITQGLIKSVSVTAQDFRGSRKIERVITITRPDGSRLYSGLLAGLWTGLSNVI